MGGSSGSPVFNKKEEVVGILRGVPSEINNKSFSENSILFQDFFEISELNGLITK